MATSTSTIKTRHLTVRPCHGRGTESSEDAPSRDHLVAGRGGQDSFTRAAIDPPLVGRFGRASEGGRQPRAALAPGRTRSGAVRRPKRGTLFRKALAPPTPASRISGDDLAAGSGITRWFG